MCALLLYGTVVCFSAQDFSDFAKKVTEFNLPNGLHFILAERHEAPVVSFHTYIKAGSANDPSGQTGLAHMFEHMAFKGTETIGSRDWPSEKKALDAIEEAYDRLEAERNKGPNADRQRLFSLETQVKNAADRAQAFVAPNEYTSIIEGAGGVGLNAGTSWDSTEYYYSLPSNRIELWFLMESQRFLQPVFREFYKERDVVAEENRMRVQSSPQGKLLQQYTATTFEAHPYRNPPGGWPSDVADLRRSEAKAFFDTYYVPSNMVIAIVGDVNPAEARRMAERYFGPMQARPLPPVLHTQEPPQTGPRTAVVESCQPAGGGGRIQTARQLPKRRCGVRCDPVDPFERKDGMAVPRYGAGEAPGRGGAGIRDVSLRAVPLHVRFPDCTGTGAHGRRRYQGTGRDSEAAADSKGGCGDIEPRQDAGARRSGPQAGRTTRAWPRMLSSTYGMYGDWRKLFTSIDDINKVTAEDVERVARQYFTAANRTTAWLAQTAQAPGAAKPAGGRQ